MVGKKHNVQSTNIWLYKADKTFDGVWSSASTVFDMVA